MKKIVGILAAAAVLATSVFAADVSAKVQLEGSLFNYDGGSNSVSAFTIDKPATQHWNPIFSVSTSTDKAGAEFAVFSQDLKTGLSGWNKGFETYVNRFKIWMSPVDGLKLIFGLNAFKLNEEHIRWSKSDSGAEDYGYSLNYAKDGLSIDLGLLPGWNTAWLGFAGNTVSVGKTALKVAYGADFGTIGALLVAENTFGKLKFGASYANNFDGTSVFVNVLGYTDSGSFSKVRAELYASGNVDAFGWSVFPVVEIYPTGANKVELFLLAKLTYQFDGVQAYFEFADLQGIINYFGKSGNTWDGANGALFTVGVNGNLGGASWDVGARINLTNTVNFSMPITLSLAW